MSRRRSPARGLYQSESELVFSLLVSFFLKGVDPGPQDLNLLSACPEHPMGLLCNIFSEPPDRVYEITSDSRSPPEAPAYT